MATMNTLQHMTSGPVAAACQPHNSSGVLPRGQWSGKRSAPRSVVARVASTVVPTKDVTADIMEAAIRLALQSRLKKHKAIDASVLCDAWGVLDGSFNNMQIIGKHWETPLGLTAHRLEVDIGTLQVDYSSLVWERRVALKNMPRGGTRIVLSGKDLGNFVTHPLFKQVATKAVQGHPFDFDPSTVEIQHSATGGEVRYEGTWGANGERYKVLMRPAPRGSATGRGKGKLQVGALHIQEGGGAGDTAGAQEVAAGMAHFFTHMALDLQGIELQSPSLALHPASAFSSQEGDLLDISMQVRIRAFPPLDMQF